MASLRPVFAPRSVAVIGASRRTGTVGRSVLDNIKAGGYAGRLYAVNPNAREVGGVPCFPDVESLPEPPDLAVLAVPPLAVVDTAERAGGAGCAASSCSPPPSTRRPAPACSPPAAGTGCA